MSVVYFLPILSIEGKIWIFKPTNLALPPASLPSWWFVRARLQANCFKQTVPGVQDIPSPQKAEPMREKKRAQARRLDFANVYIYIELYRHTIYLQIDASYTLACNDCNDCILPDLLGWRPSHQGRPQGSSACSQSNSGWSGRMWHMAGRFSVRASTHGKHQTWNSLVKGLTNKNIKYYQGLMSWSFPMALLKTSWHIDCLGGLILSRFQNSTVPLNQRGSKVFKTQNDDGGPSWAWRPSWGFSTFKLLGTE